MTPYLPCLCLLALIALVVLFAAMRSSQITHGSEAEYLEWLKEQERA